MCTSYLRGECNRLMQTQTTLLEFEMRAVGHGTQHLATATSIEYSGDISLQTTVLYKSQLNALNGLGRATSLKSCQELSFLILM